MLRLPINRAMTISMLVVLTIGGALAGAPFWGRFFVSDDMALLTVPIVGVALAAPAFTALCLLVRCQRCRYRLFWYAVSKRRQSDSIEWFRTAHQCPKCGYSVT